ncbi:MAG: ATP synthase F1 subunit delta [Cyanobium sp.]
MPLLNTITTPWAEAFLQVTESRSESEGVIDQVRSLLALWQESPELRHALSSPVLEVGSKKAALESLFGESVAPSLLNLLRLLADRQRIGMLDAVLERILDLYRQQNNIALASVTSAVALNESQLAQISDRARVVAGTEKVELQQRVDASLIGGFVLSVGSKVLDASLAGQVRRLGLSLAQVS